VNSSAQSKHTAFGGEKMSVDYFEVVMTADRLQFIPVTESQDNPGGTASRNDDLHPVRLPLLAPDEPRAPIAILSPAKRAALLACLNGGTLYKRCGMWTVPSASTYDKPVSGVTVADLRRDGMLTLTVLGSSTSVRLTTRGSWFARTAAAEMAK
jgi:hypothetical protein